MPINIPWYVQSDHEIVMQYAIKLLALYRRLAHIPITGATPRRQPIRENAMPNETEATETATDAKRARVCTKRYLDADNTANAHATPDAVAMQFAFVGGETLRVEMSNFPPNIVDCLAWHGMGQVLGDAYAGKSGDDAIEAFQTKLERLTSGDWVKPREGLGPQPSLVIEAVCAALQNAGADVDDERRESIAGKLKTPEARKRALATPAIAAEYERLKADRAIKRAKLAAEKADIAGSAGGLDLGGF